MAAEYAIWRSRFFDGLDLIESGKRSGRYPLHLHAALEIIWIRSGYGEIICRDQHCIGRPGEAFVISPNEFHGGGTAHGDALCFCLIHIPLPVVPPGFLRSYFSARQGVRSRPIQLVRAADATAVLEPLVDGLTQARSSAEEQAGTVHKALRRLNALAPVTRTAVSGYRIRHPAIEQVKSIILADCTSAVNVHDLACRVHLNERYLISLFKRATGIPPHRFQIGIRVDLARRLLPSGAPLSLIAASSGFADQSHLNRHFKRQYGVTPGEFRRLLQPI